MPPKDKEFKDPLFETLYISRVEKTFFSSYIILYDDVDYAAKILDDYLFKVRNFEYDNKEYID